MDENEKDKFLKGDIAKELDFYRIREQIAKLAASEEAKELLESREASSNKEQIDYLKNLGREWSVILHSTFPVKFSSWPPVKQYFKILGIQGSSLLQEEFYALGIFCSRVHDAKESIFSVSLKENIPHLQNLVSSLPPLENAKNEIFSVLDFNGQIRDLPQLREIKARIAAINKEIEGAIKKYTSDSKLANVLQSNVPVYKADRQLLAVKANQKSQISGIIHEVSSSGQTLYVEPEELVRANNALVQEEYNLESQIKQIFCELTSRLSVYKTELQNAHNTMLLLDQTYAAARWQKETNGVFAEDTDSSLPCKIIGARHPLLAEKAVPVNINFSEGKRILIITGANTGGKTVTLKTIALFMLLNQSGFSVPASEGTRLPIFQSIFADIGDEQSIDNSLSTFSSHMKKTALMLKNATENSLILLDEFGSGTDPQEGGAIAMSVLDELIEKKSFVIATTHHGILKNYGYTNQFCENASVEFDPVSMKPTYTLLMGIPGESHAIDIASNSGISPEIIKRARNYIATEQADVSSLIKGLSAKHTELNEAIKNQKSAERALEQKSIKLEQKELSLKQKELELKEIERTKSSEFLRKTRSELENLVRKLREGEITREKTLGVKKFISDFEQSVKNQEDEIENRKSQIEEQSQNLEEKKAKFAANGMRISSFKGDREKSKKGKKTHSSNAKALQNAEVSQIQLEAKNQINSKAKKVPVQELEFKSGMQVYAFSSKREGTLVRELKGEKWSVQFGSVKMEVPKNQLVIKNSQPNAKKVDFVFEAQNPLVAEKPQFELRLLGMRQEEAIKALEKQIDLCQINNFKNFSVIHGKGNGILQQAVSDFLSNYPLVKNFHFASPEDGGSGKTYVELL